MSLFSLFFIFLCTLFVPDDKQAVLFLSCEINHFEFVCTVCSFTFVILMDFWSYASEGKGLLFSDEIDLSVDAFARSRKTLIGWDTESVESTEFIDFGFSEIPRKPFHGSKTGVGVLGGTDGGIDSSKLVASSPNCMIASNSSMESGSNHSNSLVESNSQESSLIDLKLGRLADFKDAQNSKFSKERLLSSVSPTAQAKRARATCSRPQTTYCQVYGCNKDLSSSKDYHKRHKVCEVHSKTPQVIVDGNEQRFCQQCSRLVGYILVFVFFFNHVIYLSA